MLNRIRGDEAGGGERVDSEPKHRAVFMDALRVVLGRPYIWLFCWALLAVPAMMQALPWAESLRGAIGEGYAPGEVTYDMGAVFRQDHGTLLSALRSQAALQSAFFGIIALLIGVFVAGGWLQILLERTHGEGLRRFFMGGSRYFWRFLRVALCTLLVLSLLSWLLYDEPWKKFVLGGLFDIPKWDRKSLETLESEATFRRLEWAQAGLFALGFAFIRVWADYTRTRLALNDGKSALVAGSATLFTIFRHPMRTLRPMLVLALLSMLVLTLAGFVSSLVEGGFEGSDAPSLWRVGFLALIGQAALLMREVFRGASYGAAVRISTDLIAPPPGRDPWQSSVGGPGGPRYPIEDGDEFGVSM